MDRLCAPAAMPIFINSEGCKGIHEDVGQAVNVSHWLHPGMAIKRWLALLVAGITLLSLSAGYLLRSLYGARVVLPPWVPTLTLQFLGREMRGGLFLIAGAIVTAIALVRLNRTVINALLPRRNG